MVLFKENSDGHDFDHSMRVYHNAMKIAKCEQSCDKEVVALASLLHDVDDHKLFDTKNDFNARCFLKTNNIDTRRTDIICQAINEVSSESKMVGLHGITGALAIILMLVHAIWATVVLIRKNQQSMYTFHRFSMFVWIVWLIPYILGMMMGMGH